MRHTLRFSALALGLAGMLAASGQTARAEFFSYTSTVNVTSDGSAPASSGGGTSALATIPAGTINFIANSESGPIDSTQPGGADFNFGSIDFNPNPANTKSAPYSVNFNYQVVFTDLPSGKMATVNFTGTESGFARGNPRFINSTFTSFAVAPTTITLAGETFIISAKSATGPGSSGATLGSLQGNIRAVPEPGSVALLGVGLVGAYGLLQRRRSARTA